MVVLLALSGGCKTPVEGTGKAASKTEAASRGPVFLTVDFQPGQTLRYKFTSKKNITLDWNPNAGSSAGRVQELAEDCEIVVAYTPVEVDPYGVSTVRATVESVTVQRSGGRTFGTDAVQTAQGKSFILKVDPRGKIVDSAQLNVLIKEMGEKAFRADTSGGRIKEPDMIGDFTAGQWFLWDAASKIERPADGVVVGQTWRSQLSVPTPMVLREARDVVYRLDKIGKKGTTGTFADIKSTYTLADSAPVGWPIPYSGRFQMPGTFGFLSSYEVLDLEGAGEELFDIDAGRIERQRQTYAMRMKAGLPPMGIRANPTIFIVQTLTMELMNDEDSESESRNSRQTRTTK